MSACPTPWKLGFVSRPEARLAARRGQHNLKGGSLKPYHCACGCWHNSSMSKREHKLKTRRRKAA